MNRLLTFVLMFSLIFIGCSKSDELAEDCLNFKHALITNVDLDTFEVNKNEDLTIDVSFNLLNSCGSFYSFEVDRNELVYDIKVKAKYEGCDCTEEIRNVKHTYYFRAADEGIYILKFYTSTTDFITKVVIVK